MKSKLLNENGQKTYLVVFDSGDEVISGITQFAKNNQLNASQISAIGAFSEATLGFFNFSIKDYKKIPVQEQVEVLTLNGDITLKPGGGVQVHVHTVLGKADGTAHGGHLLSAKVHPTLEVIITESPAHLNRKKDEETGLALISV